MISKKCPICNSCLNIVGTINKSTFVWECDFCLKFFKKIPGGLYEEINKEIVTEWFFGKDKV